MGKKVSGKKKQSTAQALPDQKKTKRLFMGIIVVFAFVLYGNTIGNDYSFDDIYVTNNREVKQGLSVIPKLFVSLYANMYEDGKPLTFGYRPVVKTTFVLEYSLFGNNPHASHFINILIYALTCLLLFLALQKLFKDYHYLFPLVVTLLFMAHPSHTEVVSSLKNRDELLSFLGAIGSLYLFLLYVDKGKTGYGFLGLFVFLLAFLSKPTVSVFLPLFPVVLYFFTKPKTGQVLFILLGSIVVLYLATSVPRLYLPKPDRPVQFIENPLFFEESLWIKLATGLTIVLFYFKMLIFPHPMRFYYGFDTIEVVGWDNAWVYVSLFLHLGLLALAIWKIKQKRFTFNFKKFKISFRFFSLIWKIPQKHVLSFGILIYLLAIGTFSNILKQPMGIAADRFMYFPSLGFSIVIGYLLYKLFRMDPNNNTILKSNNTKVLALLFLILIPYTAKTIDRNMDWKDQPTLLRNDIQYLENSAKANFIYAGTMKGELMKDIRSSGKKNPNHLKAVNDIIHHLNLAINTYPEYYQAYEMRGTIYITFFKRYDEAIADFNRALEIKPNYIPSFSGLGFCYHKKKQYSKAISAYEKTIELSPEHLTAYRALFNIYKELGNAEKANYYGQKSNDLKKELDARMARGEM